MKKLAVLTLIIMSLSTTLFSQDSTRVGISGTIQGNQYGILVPIFITENFALVPAIEIIYAESVGLDLGIAIAPRYYIKKSKLSPYCGLKLGIIMNEPLSESKETSNSTAVDLLGGLAFGAEYFLSNNLSFGIELQGNITKSGKNSNRFGNPDGININTGTMLFATIYF